MHTPEYWNSGANSGAKEGFVMKDLFKKMIIGLGVVLVLFITCIFTIMLISILNGNFIMSYSVFLVIVIFYGYFVDKISNCYSTRINAFVFLCFLDFVITFFLTLYIGYGYLN